jgi:MFS superfamily sulfate permease-like transporter
LSEQKSRIDLYKQYWKQDLLAAVSVSLVAMPLALGIAIASGSPPISGFIAAIIGGVITTFIRGSHIAINGPANSLIVVILAANSLLSVDGQNAFPFVLAAICVAGLLQVVIGILKLGRLGEVVPSSVMHGLLAGIGIIILVKQIHVGFGHQSMASSTIGSILEIPKSIFNLNPMITFITLVSLAIMMVYPRVKNKLFHYVPAPVWVLVFAIPVVYIHRHWLVPFFDISSPSFQYPKTELISLPSDVWSSIVFPDFGMIDTVNFWVVVFTILIVTTIETLVSTKAVDQLDPLRRKTNLNKDLRGMGISSALSGLLGGLPIVTVVVRSSVNVSNNGKTGLSNLFHGLIILLFLLGLQPLLEQVPLAALAAILIYTGYGLTSPSNFVAAYEKGEEQLLIMVFSVICVLLYGLLWGLFLGLMMTQLLQWVKSRMSIKAFFQAIFRPRMQYKQLDDRYEIRLSGIFNFLNLLKLKSIIYQTPVGEKVEINMDNAILIDHSVMEFIDSYGKNYTRKGGHWIVTGLENHETASSHPHSMRILQPQHQHSPRWMTEHQRQMMKISAQHGWQFVIGKEFNNDHLLEFPLFNGHPVEYVHNTATGLLPKHNLYFTLQDIVFDEGALISKIAYDTTVIIVELRQAIPAFVLEKEELFDRILQRAGKKDIEFEDDLEFSKRELVSGTDEEATKHFFNKKIRAYILANDSYHIESTGGKLLIFNKTERLSLEEMEQLIQFSIQFIDLVSDRLDLKPSTPEV